MANDGDSRKLEFPEAIRKRPGMYAGGANINGLHQCAYNILENAVDEFMSGRCKRISVELHPDNSLCITDDGCGIPVAVHPELGVSTLELVTGRFFRKPVSNRLNGIGAKVTNALSEWFHATVHRDGGKWELRYVRGIKQCEVTRVGDSTEHGTRIHFIPDSTIFPPDLSFDAIVLEERLREQCFLNPGLNIEFRDARDDEHKHICYPDGIRQFLRESNSRLEVCHDVIACSGEREDVQVDIAFHYTQTREDRVRSFVNHFKIESGTQEDGLIQSLQHFFSEGNAGEAAMRRGLSAIVSVKLVEPCFKGPSRFHLNNPEAERAVRSILTQELSRLVASDDPAVAAIRRKIQDNVNNF